MNNKYDCIEYKRIRVSGRTYETNHDGYCSDGYNYRQTDYETEEVHDLDEDDIKYHELYFETNGHGTRAYPIEKYKHIRGCCGNIRFEPKSVMLIKNIDKIRFEIDLEENKAKYIEMLQNMSNLDKKEINKLYIRVCSFIGKAVGGKFTREMYLDIYSKPELGWNQLLDLLKDADKIRKNKIFYYIKYIIKKN